MKSFKSFAASALVATATLLSVAVTTPAQACVGCTIKLNGTELNGIRLNGVQFNGWKVNGIQLNGWRVNGIQLNGWKINGLQFNGFRINGLQFNGIQLNGLGENIEGQVIAVTLPVRTD